MKCVTKFSCAILISLFISSCASQGSGCYDFGYEATDNKIELNDHDYHFEVELKKKIESQPTICVD